eukprot:224958-Rhodomonas_salina.1
MIAPPPLNERIFDVASASLTGTAANRPSFDSGASGIFCPVTSTVDGAEDLFHVVRYMASHGPLGLMYFWTSNAPSTESRKTLVSILGLISWQSFPPSDIRLMRRVGAPCSPYRQIGRNHSRSAVSALTIATGSFMEGSSILAMIVSSQ